MGHPLSAVIADEPGWNNDLFESFAFNTRSAAARLLAVDETWRLTLTQSRYPALATMRPSVEASRIFPNVPIGVLGLPMKGTGRRSELGWRGWHDVGTT